MLYENTPTLHTERLVLRKFTQDDAQALFELLSDQDVNKFLPWFPIGTVEEALDYLQHKILPCYTRNTAYYYAITLKPEDRAIGYLQINDIGGSNDLGYGLKKDFWHKGIAAEACMAVCDRFRAAGYSYLTATHDINNPDSGAVMKKLGMTYRYSYKELWQPKNFMVTFRLYQLDFADRVGSYTEYQKQHPSFVEQIAGTEAGADRACEPSNPQLRPYRSADCPVLAELFCQTVHTVNAQDYTEPQLAVWAGAVDMAAWDRSFLNHHTLIAEQGGRIVGFGDMDDTGYLDRLYVHKDCQGRGIATAIATALERQAAEQGVHRFTTHASITARLFFEKRGYCTLRENTVLRQGVALTNYIMEKMI